MHFSDYLKRCRLRFGLSQSQLAEHLYAFHPVFEGVDTVTVSRWERGAHTPSVTRIRYIVEALQHFDDSLFPCLDTIDFHTVENELMRTDIRRVIGKHKPFILDFPQHLYEREGLGWGDIASFDDPNSALRIAYTFLRHVTPPDELTDYERYATLALHSGARFYVATYHRQLFGTLFSLQLKTEPFEALMRFELEERNITPDMLVSDDEEGYAFIMHFFAYHNHAAALIALRYYRYLYATSHNLFGAGALPKRKEGEVLAQTLGLEAYKQDTRRNRRSYRATMTDILLNPYILRIFFKLPST
jgi:transcriptional regulator with XRE-family HTH domain